MDVSVGMREGSARVSVAKGTRVPLQDVSILFPEMDIMAKYTQAVDLHKVRAGRGHAGQVGRTGWDLVEGGGEGPGDEEGGWSAYGSGRGEWGRRRTGLFSGVVGRAWGLAGDVAGAAGHSRGKASVRLRFAQLPLLNSTPVVRIEREQSRRFKGMWKKPVTTLSLKKAFATPEGSVKVSTRLNLAFGELVKARAVPRWSLNVTISPSESLRLFSTMINSSCTCQQGVVPPPGGGLATPDPATKRREKDSRRGAPSPYTVPPTNHLRSASTGGTGGPVGDDSPVAPVSRQLDFSNQTHVAGPTGDSSAWVSTGRRGAPGGAGPRRGAGGPGTYRKAEQGIEFHRRMILGRGGDSVADVSGCLFFPSELDSLGGPRGGSALPHVEINRWKVKKHIALAGGDGGESPNRFGGRARVWRKCVAIVPGHWIDPANEKGAPGEAEFNLEVADKATDKLQAQGWRVLRPDREARVGWDQYLQWVNGKTRWGVSVVEIHGQGGAYAHLLGAIADDIRPMNQALKERFGDYPGRWYDYSVARRGGCVLECFNTEELADMDEKTRDRHADKIAGDIAAAARDAATGYVTYRSESG